MPTIIRLTNASEAGASVYANLDLVKSFCRPAKDAPGTVLSFTDGTQLVIAEDPDAVHGMCGDM